MRRTAETDYSKDADVEDADVESAIRLVRSSGAPHTSASRVARWLQLALVVLLFLSATSVFVYSDDIQAPSDSLDRVNDAARGDTTLQAVVKSAPDVPSESLPQATSAGATPDANDEPLAQTPAPSANVSATVDTPEGTPEVAATKRLAYMFYVTSDIYGCAALHLMDNLVNTVKMDTSRIDLVVLHSSAVSHSTLTRIQAAVNARLIPVDSIRADVSGDTWLESLTKFNAFRDWGYDRVVYMDADAVPMQNLDHLFDLPPAPLYAPTAYWLKQPFFASALLVIEPSNAQFDAIIAWARKRGSAAGYDMDILNVYFAKSVKYLPGDYIVLNSDFRAKPDAKNKLYKTTTELKRHVKLVHFSCKPDGSYGKPWTSGSHDLTSVKKQGFDPLFAELYEAFWKTQAEKCN